MMESTISSPSLITRPPKLWATRLIASVALRVKISLILGRRIEEAAHAFAGILEALGCRVGEKMQAAMDVGIFLGVALHDGIEHGLWLLRRGGVVEIDQGLAIDLAREDGKVAADCLDIEARRDCAMLAVTAHLVLGQPVAGTFGQRFPDALMGDQCRRLRRRRRR